MKYIARLIDQQGLQVDFLFPSGNRRLFLLKAKASRTAVPEMAEPLQRLSKAVSSYDVASFVIYRPPEEEFSISALRPGVNGFPLTYELAGSGLPKRSWVKISQIRTLSIKPLGKKIERVDPGELETMMEGLNEILGG